MANIPPAPVGTPFGSFTWADWYEKIRRILNDGLINHNELQNLQGGSLTERYHLTLAEYNKAKDAMSIKGIQRGVISFSGTTTNATATITAVDPTKTELRFLGSAEQINSSGSTGANILLLNSTTIQANRYNPGTSIALTVSWELTEYN
jgi:hypothetical protein